MRQGDPVLLSLLPMCHLIRMVLWGEIHWAKFGCTFIYGLYEVDSSPDQIIATFWCNILQHWVLLAQIFCATFVDVAWCCSHLARFVQQCCSWTCALVQFSTLNIKQHIATGWPNAWSMCPTILWFFGPTMMGYSMLYLRMMCLIKLSEQSCNPNSSVVLVEHQEVIGFTLLLYATYWNKLEFSPNHK